jgi:hypothetical protein
VVAGLAMAVHEVHGRRFVGRPAKWRGMNPRGPPPGARPFDSTVKPRFPAVGDGQGFVLLGLPSSIAVCLWLFFSLRNGGVVLTSVQHRECKN